MDSSIQSKGGLARAEKLSAGQKTEIARKGAAARWGNKVFCAGELAFPSAPEETRPSIPCAVFLEGGKFTFVLSMEKLKAAFPEVVLPTEATAPTQFFGADGVRYEAVYLNALGGFSLGADLTLPAVIPQSSDLFYSTLSDHLTLSRWISASCGLGHHIFSRSITPENVPPQHADLIPLITRLPENFFFHYSRASGVVAKHPLPEQRIEDACLFLRRTLIDPLTPENREQAKSMSIAKRNGAPIPVKELALRVAKMEAILQLSTPSNLDSNINRVLG